MKHLTVKGDIFLESYEQTINGEKITFATVYDKCPYNGWGHLRNVNMNLAKYEEKDVPTKDIFNALIIYRGIHAYDELVRLGIITDEEFTMNKRISDITERILKCSNPSELIKEFNFIEHEIENHSDELNHYICVELRYEDVEIMEMAVKLLNISGNFGEGVSTDGYVYIEFTPITGGLKGYQENCIRYFNNPDEFLHKSSPKCVNELLDDDEFADGYYDIDCDDYLILESKELYDKKFTGYYEDIRYNFFCFKFEHMDKF